MSSTEDSYFFFYLFTRLPRDTWLTRGLVGSMTTKSQVPPTRGDPLRNICAIFSKSLVGGNRETRAWAGGSKSRGSKGAAAVVQQV